MLHEDGQCYSLSDPMAMYSSDRLYMHTIVSECLSPKRVLRGEERRV